MWNKDLNNFGPTLGFAWDPFKDGKTSVRGGYSLTFVNEEGGHGWHGCRRERGALDCRRRCRTCINGWRRVSPSSRRPHSRARGRWPIRSRVSPTSVIRGMDEDVKQPHVHQFSAGISREIMWNMAVEARYVGTRGRDIWRGVDLNQLDAIGALGGAFAADFQRARQNGYPGAGRRRRVRPGLQPQHSGQPGRSPCCRSSGSSAWPSVRTAIQQNEPARLADLYMTTGGATAAARAAFLRNPGIYASEYVSNTSFQDYNGLQMELRRQFRNGIFGQINYTFSKTTSDSIGNASQNRIEPFLDNARPELDDGLLDLPQRAMSSTPTACSSCRSARASGG